MPTYEEQIQEYKKMRTAPKRVNYTLDVSKWRCGGDEYSTIYRAGEGITAMLNEEGYMCCLGQFALQTKGDTAKERMLNLRTPLSLAACLQEAYDPNFVSIKSSNFLEYDLTALGENLIRINDSKITTVEHKIKMLVETLAKEGISLEVISSK